ncbi:MAG: 50S ribosomal protein L23 [Rhizomicrobium sp.]
MTVHYHHDVILSPVITEKATKLTETNQVVFRVPLSATKPKIAAAVAELFKVKVKAVNTVTVKGKKKLARGKPYTRSDFKKAIVTLAEGEQIDITTGL